MLRTGFKPVTDILIDINRKGHASDEIFIKWPENILMKELRMRYNRNHQTVTMFRSAVLNVKNQIFYILLCN